MDLGTVVCERSSQPLPQPSASPDHSSASEETAELNLLSALGSVYSQQIPLEGEQTVEIKDFWELQGAGQGS